MGDGEKASLRLQFNPKVRLAFHGATITTDAGLLAFREFGRDSPDQTNFPGYSSFWDTVKYNPAFQGRQMRPDSLKFPVFI